MDVERADAIPVTKAELKPVVVETLRSLGWWTVGARVALQKDNWTLAIRQIFGVRARRAASLRKHLSQLSAGYANGSQHQTGLAEETSPKYIRFYDSLAALLVDCFGEAEVGRALKTGSASPPGSLLYGESVSILAIHGLQVASFFTIPNNPCEQLQLAKELGPQIYKGWQSKPQETATPQPRRELVLR